MSPTPRSLAARLRAGERLVGALVRMPCEDVVEMLAVAGVDLVVVDCEHGPADVGALRRHVTAAQVHGVPVLVRTGQGEDALVLRALDQGAVGVVAPHVDSADEARAVVRSAHYPPQGARGFATYPRAGRFGTLSPDEHRERAAAETVVVVMVESPTAVRDVAEVLAVPGVDGYLVGPADLAASRTPDDPPLEELLADVHRRAGGAGARVDVVGSRAQADAAVTDGAQVVLYNVAHLLMATLAGLRPGGP